MKNKWKERLFHFSPFKSEKNGISTVEIFEFLRSDNFWTILPFILISLESVSFFHFVSAWVCCHFVFFNLGDSIETEWVKNIPANKNIYINYFDRRLFSLPLGMARVIVGRSCMHSLHAYLSLRTNTLIETKSEGIYLFCLARISTCICLLFTRRFHCCLEEENKTKQKERRRKWFIHLCVVALVRIVVSYFYRGQLLRHTYSYWIVKRLIECVSSNWR